MAMSGAEPPVTLVTMFPSKLLSPVYSTLMPVSAVNCVKDWFSRSASDPVIPPEILTV